MQCFKTRPVWKRQRQRQWQEGEQEDEDEDEDENEDEGEGEGRGEGEEEGGTEWNGVVGGPSFYLSIIAYGDESLKLESDTSSAMGSGGWASKFSVASSTSSSDDNGR